MEGSRHERVALVVATYVIGFVTAFIAFGVTQLEDSVTFVYVPQAAQTAAIADAMPAATASVDSPVVSLRPEGLYLVRGAEEGLISAVTAEGGDDGLAVAITQYELSPDGSFVYFCEQSVASIDACVPFIYSLSNDVVIPVTQAGERVAFLTSAQELVWNEAGLVSVGGEVVDPIPQL